MKALTTALLLCCVSSAAYAQEEPTDGPQRPALPDLTADTKELGDARKYVVFHKPGISYEDALRDMTACARHSNRSAARKTDYFVPRGRDDKGNPVVYDGGNFGLVGAVLASIIDGPIERSVRQTTMIRCMTPRGYTRYRAAKDQWQEIFEKRDDWVQVAAVIASGPVPPTPEAKP